MIRNTRARRKMMRRTVLLVIAAGLLVAGDSAKENVQKELEKFRGTWKFVSIENEGQAVPKAQYEGARLTLKGDQFTFRQGADSTHGTFKVDPAKQPKTIDVTFTDGPDKGKTIVGVYELKGDTYKVCLQLKGKERPKEFRSQAESGHVLQVLQRVRP
jgi:uncharacterized protein (TIGR03067 family)